MSNFLIGGALGALVAAFISAPFVAPWRFRVRYLASAPMADPWLGLAPAPGMQTRAVTLTSVRAARGVVELAVNELGTGRISRRTTLTCESCPPCVIAELDGWATLGTPLLLVTEEDHGVHLYGPHRDVADLVLAEGKMR